MHARRHIEDQRHALVAAVRRDRVFHAQVAVLPAAIGSEVGGRKQRQWRIALAGAIYEYEQVNRQARRSLAIVADRE